jgi:hypothetical protein
MTSSSALETRKKENQEVETELKFSDRNWKRPQSFITRSDKVSKPLGNTLSTGSTSAR